MKIPVLLALIFLLNLGCSQIKSKPITEVTQEEFKSIVLVDVRTPEEYNRGHIDDALNIDWFDADFEQRFASIDKNQTIYVYCQKGGRGSKAQEKLHSMGYGNVINLEGGYEAWAKIAPIK